MAMANAPGNVNHHVRYPCSARRKRLGMSFASSEITSGRAQLTPRVQTANTGLVGTRWTHVCMTPGKPARFLRSLQRFVSQPGSLDVFLVDLLRAGGSPGSSELGIRGAPPHSSAEELSASVRTVETDQEVRLQGVGDLVPGARYTV
jgi:hypothetical protein